MIQRQTTILCICFLLLCMSTSFIYAADEESPAQQTKLKFKLQQITISATKTERNPIMTPGEVSVIDQETIQQRQAQSLDDVIRYEPGLDSQIGPRQMGESPNIRGLSGPRVLMLIDGVRLNFQSAHKGRVFFDMDQLKQVEVIRGPGSALYGSQALGGVISMVTKDPSDYLGPDSKFSIRQKFGYQENNVERLSSTTMAARLGEHFEIMGTGTFRSGENIRFGDGKGRLKNSAQDNAAGFGKILWKPTAHDEAKFSVQVTRQAADIPVNTNSNTTNLARIANRTNRQFTYRFGYTHNDPDNPYINLTAMAYHTTLDITERQLSNSARDDINFDTTGFDIRNSMNFGDAKTHHHIITLGTEYYHNYQDGRGNRTIGASLLFPKGTSDVIGLYAQDEISIFNDRLVLIPGLRWDRWENKSKGESKKDADRVNPKIGGVIKATDFLFLEANYAHGFRQPGFQDLFISGTHFPGSVFKANTDLKPERSKNIDAGVRIVLPHVFSNNDTFIWKGAYFRNTLKDFIDFDVSFDSSTSQLEFMPVNVTKALIKGFESELEWHPINNIILRGNYTYTHGTNQTDNEPLTNIPANRGLISLAYYHPSWGMTFGGRSQITGNQNRVPNGTMKTGGYTLFDLYLTMEPPRSFFKQLGAPWLHGLRVNAGIDNLTNLNYRRHLSNLPEAGINPKISTAYIFKF